VYVILAIGMYGSSWLHGIGHTLQCGGCGDNGQQVWFLAWGGHALTNLVDPLRTNWVNYPYGADLANNTSMPFAAFLGTPITLLLGPIAAYNVLLTFAFASAATAAMFACRRWVRSRGAAFLGGLLYGFSPYMVGQGAGHLFLVLALGPPLTLLVLDEILVAQRHRWWVAGLALGLLEVVQLGFSIEMFADVALVALIGAILVVITRPDVRERLPQAARSLGLALLVVCPFVALYVVIGRTGPEHVTGAVRSVTQLAGLRSDLSSPIAPTVNQFVNFGTSSFGSRLVTITPKPGHVPIPEASENGAYVGIPLLLLLFVGLYKYRRDGVLRFAAAMAAASFLLSMGGRLDVLGHATSIPLPFAVLEHLPLVDDEVASRYSVFMWLFVALALALILDRWLPNPAPERRRGRDGIRRWSTRTQLGRVLPVSLLLAGLVSLIPYPQYKLQGVVIPTWFQSTAVDRVPVGSTLLTYPLARDLHNPHELLPELWQAANGMTYRIPAGEVNVPKFHFGALEEAFLLCWTNSNEDVPPPWLVAKARADIKTWHVETIVVPEQYPDNASCAVNFLEQVLQRPPDVQYGAAVWSFRVG